MPGEAMRHPSLTPQASDHLDQHGPHNLEPCEQQIKRLVSIAVVLPALIGLTLWEAEQMWEFTRGPIIAVLVATGLCISLYVRHQVKAVSRMYVVALTAASKPKTLSPAGIPPADRCKQNSLHRV